MQCPPVFLFLSFVSTIYWASLVFIILGIPSRTLMQLNCVYVQNLPYDAYMLLAVPAPIGGVLVFCANSIHYHSQVLHAT